MEVEAQILELISCHITSTRSGDPWQQVPAGMGPDLVFIGFGEHALEVALAQSSSCPRERKSRTASANGNGPPYCLRWAST